MPHPGGRPTEYGPEILSKAREYLDKHCTDKEIGSEDGKNTKFIVRLPSIEGLCLFLKIHRSTCYDWKAKYQEFSDIIEELMQSQAFVLLNNGLSGAYNPTISKVILSKHGYSEKIENDNTNKTTIELSGELKHKSDEELTKALFSHLK